MHFLFILFDGCSGRREGEAESGPCAPPAFPVNRLCVRTRLVAATPLLRPLCRTCACYNARMHASMAQSDQLIRPSSSATPAAPPTSHSFAQVDTSTTGDASPRASSRSHCANPPTAMEAEPASVRGASSRDQTNGNGSPASTSAAASLLPTEGFAGLFFVAASGGKGLSLELFLNVMRHVRDESQAALIQAGQVCSTWRKATHRNCELWTSLGTVVLGAEADMQRLREIASRAKVRLLALHAALAPRLFGLTFRLTRLVRRLVALFRQPAGVLARG